MTCSKHGGNDIGSIYCVFCDAEVAESYKLPAERAELPERWQTIHEFDESVAISRLMQEEIDALRERLQAVESEVATKRRVVAAAVDRAVAAEKDVQRLVCDTTANQRVAELTAAERDAMLERRYIWAVNALLACDYGDNDSEQLIGKRQVGWHVYGWQNRNGELRIFGKSMQEAIDQYLDEHPEIAKSVDSVIGKVKP